MAGNSFGTLFRVTTFGESHGPAVGVVVDGCPPRLAARRRGDPARAGPPPPRPERDHHAAPRGRPGRDPVGPVRGPDALGTPIAMLVRNEDMRSGDYDEMRTKFRPSHADYTYEAKYGIRAWQGGGRASARETVGRVGGRRGRAQAARQRRRGGAPGRHRRLGRAGRRTSRPTVDPGHGHARRRRRQHRALPRRGDGRAR